MSRLIPKLNRLARKYRDELRPRQGLLRAREFLMKDLYTFDSSEESALQTYESIRNAYAAFFEEFKIPYITAEASSGDIGGDLSHEYHLISSNGEDQIITCTSCTYVANEELAGLDQARRRASSPVFSSTSAGNSASKSTKPQEGLYYSDERQGEYSVWRGISQDRLVLYEAIFPSKVEFIDNSTLSVRNTEINRHALKKYAEDVDFSVENPSILWHSTLRTEDNLGVPRSHEILSICRLYDYRIPQSFIDKHETTSQLGAPGSQLKSSIKDTQFPPIDLVKLHTGDRCSKCDTGTIKVQNAIELGHTFHLGTRYSKRLQATFNPEPSLVPNASIPATAIAAPDADKNLTRNPPPGQSFLQMGCHGIGVSRMIAAIAEALRDSKGLNWPRVMAPFEAVIIPTKGLEADAVGVYDLLVHNQNNGSAHSGVDAILDDRNKDIGWKLTDADLIGYPIIVVLGRKWRSERCCEVQCRRLDGWKEAVPEARLREVVGSLLNEL